MKQRLPATHIEDQIAPPSATSHPSLSRASTTGPYLPPLRLKRRQRVNYAPGELPNEEPPDAPRLFIRGSGGSIKMDLRGVGTRLSAAAFAYHVPDDSLASVYIHRGDVVLVEPIYRAFCAGNLVLLEIDGQTVLKQLKQQKRLWFLNSLDNAGSAPILWTDQPLQGVAVGLVRLFTPLKPVKFRGTDTNCEISSTEIRDGIAAGRKPRAAAPVHSLSKTKRVKNNQAPSMLAAEKKGNFRLSEIDKKSVYKTWPNTR